jgi:hypothetical protein
MPGTYLLCISASLFPLLSVVWPLTLLFRRLQPSLTAFPETIAALIGSTLLAAVVMGAFIVSRSARREARLLVQTTGIGLTDASPEGQKPVAPDEAENREG